MTVKVGIVGATGYTGAELLRLLAMHPGVEILTVTSRDKAGTAVSEIFPHLRGVLDLPFAAPEAAELSDCDVVFFATPYGVCMTRAAELLARGVKVIDLSADFRLKDATVFKKWYGRSHSAPEWLEQAVYGLPETHHREAIANARLLANPGCYPTIVQLGFKPLIEGGLIETSGLIADVKSGLSGAGREAKVATLFAEIDASFTAYGASGHRHQPEIEQELAQMAGSAVDITFVPHLVPMIRGIEATLYARLKASCNDLHDAFREAYRDEPFVDVLAPGAHPETRSVRGSNMVRIGVYQSSDRSTAIVSAVGDNLIKGAAGQAVQCMNLMTGQAETTGLTQIALMP